MSEWRVIDDSSLTPRDGRSIFVVNGRDPHAVPAAVFWRPAVKQEPAGWHMAHGRQPYAWGPPTHWAPLNWA
jgi:hypothetical protein